MEIEYITIDPNCYKNKPKYHTVNIFYKSGVIEESDLEDTYILKYLYNYLKTDEDKRHFYYLYFNVSNKEIKE